MAGGKEGGKGHPRRGRRDLEKQGRKDRRWKGKRKVQDKTKSRTIKDPESLNLNRESTVVQRGKNNRKLPVHQGRTKRVSDGDGIGGWIATQ